MPKGVRRSLAVRGSAALNLQVLWHFREPCGAWYQLAFPFSGRLSPRRMTTWI